MRLGKAIATGVAEERPLVQEEQEDRADAPGRPEESRRSEGPVSQAPAPASDEVPAAR
ncbi:hypothetical protein ACL02U_22045 [Streptomyces sp. MS06]|uniref:hypothetical protein n=1 Tax=Streptomyces sp. MS06 TaxID=3385974 RepID=UPI0039A34779